MTSASIMEMPKAGLVVQAGATKTTPVNAEAQFSDAMDFASASQQENNVEATPGDDVKTHAEKSAAQHTGRKEIREADRTESKAEVSEEEISDEMEAKEEEIVKEIAEKFGVSEEEVRKIMEVLGLTVMDLLSQGNMVSLVAQLTDMQPVDVLTDENLFAQITEVTAQVEEQLQSAADMLGMTLEQLRVTVEEQVSVEENVQMPQTEAEVTVTTEPVEKLEESEVLLEETTTEQMSLKDGAATVTSVTEENGSEMDGQHKDSEEAEPELMQQGQNVQVQKGDTNVPMTEQSTPLFESSMDVEQTRELINQIADYVRVNRSETISSMEIQLHPVELGTVNLQVVAKDGSVSARLAVQDETVRAALESQIVQLRENLQQQGLKIDAVEVTVATHEFEQNLDRHGREAEERAAKEKKNGRRILDLNEIGQEDMEGGEMSDADRLQVEMMRMGGNRLNLRV